MGCLGITAQGERRIRVLNTQEQHDYLLMGKVELALEETKKPLLDESYTLSICSSASSPNAGRPTACCPRFTLKPAG
jgi:hypothetical protein